MEGTDQRPYTAQISCSACDHRFHLFSMGLSNNNCLCTTVERSAVRCVLGSSVHCCLVHCDVQSCQAHTIMDQHSNVHLKVVQGDFPIKYGPKTLKTPIVHLLKTLDHFKIKILKYNETHFCLLFFLKYWPNHFKTKNYNENTDILISNLFTE